MSDSEITLDLARQAQITRTGIVSLLNAPDRDAVVKGCFVRVLLELENGNEDYRVGYVANVQQGQPYNGFSNDPQVNTTLYLILSLPAELSGINGSQFQLNSISNSQIDTAELQDIIQSSTSWGLSVDALRQKGLVLAGKGVASRARAGQPRPQQKPAAPRELSPGGLVTEQTFTHEPLGLTRKPGNRSREDPETAGGGEEVSDEQLHRIVMEELRESHQVFPTNPESMKTQLLRTTERDLLEYLDQIRDAIRQNRPNCVVCLERAPTIISLPCKHQVLCRLCATQVKCCPACREVMVEIFEPVEI